MKILSIIALLLLNSLAISFFLGPDTLKVINPKTAASDSLSLDSIKSASTILAKEREPKYSIIAQFRPTEGQLLITENITWYNDNSDSLSSLLFHVYPNAFKSNKTIFAQDREIPRKSFTSVEISSVQVNNKPAALSYVNTEVSNPNDSTIAKIALSKPIHLHDSLLVSWQYMIRLPRAFCRLGSDPSKTSFSIADCFIKPGIASNGHWQCSPYYPFTGFNEGFGTYTVSINAPTNFKAVASGDLVSFNEERDTATFTYFAKHISNFACFLSSRYEQNSVDIHGKNSLTVTYFFPPEYKKFLPRYTTALQSAYSFLESSYGTSTLQRTSFVIASEYVKDMYPIYSSGLSVLSHKYLTPEGELLPERMIINAFVEQYLASLFSSDKVTESWFTDGLAAYLTNIILEKYYERPLSYIYYFDVYPVRGLTLIQFADIPLVYTITKLAEPTYSGDLQNFYSSALYSSLAENGSVYHTKEIFSSATASRGAIFFHTLKNMLGEKRLSAVLHIFFARYSYRHAGVQDFIKTLRSACTDTEFAYAKQFYEVGGFSDYQILSVKQSAAGLYAVHLANSGNIAYPVKLYAYTEKDTMNFHIDPMRKFQTVYCWTNAPARVFIVDPGFENLFDLSFANNSYTMEANYGSSLYLSLRWFYWMQSIFMIFGGLS